MHAQEADWPATPTLMQLLLSAILQAEGLHMSGNPAAWPSRVLAVLAQRIPLGALLTPPGQLPAA